MEVEEVEIKEDSQIIINDTSSIFEDLKEFSKRADVKKKVELIEKEAYLEEKLRETKSRFEKELSEIEKELDSVRGELAVS